MACKVVLGMLKKKHHFAALPKDLMSSRSFAAI
jgi:hypothetical protein